MAKEFGHLIDKVVFLKTGESKYAALGDTGIQILLEEETDNFLKGIRTYEFDKGLGDAYAISKQSVLDVYEDTPLEHKITALSDQIGVLGGAERALAHLHAAQKRTLEKPALKSKLLIAGKDAQVSDMKNTNKEFPNATIGGK